MHVTVAQGLDFHYITLDWFVQDKPDSLALELNILRLE